MLKLSIALAALLAGFAHAQVYKCPGPNGQTIFSQAPCTDGSLVDRRKPTSTTEQAARAQQRKQQFDPSTAQPEQAPAPQRVAAPNDCPDDQQYRNLQTSASSVTVSKAEQQKRQVEVEAAARCRANRTSFSEELGRMHDENQARQARQAETRQAVREQLRRCSVIAGGIISCSRN
jgi:flagellar biosynthesis GTPase FlhF